MVNSALKNEGIAEGIIKYLQASVPETELKTEFNKALCVVFKSTLTAEYYFLNYYPQDKFVVYEQAWGLE